MIHADANVLIAFTGAFVMAIILVHAVIYYGSLIANILRETMDKK